jgi:hypothetical protein
LGDIPIREEGRNIMPLDVFTDPVSVTITGPITVSKDPVSGLDGTMTVNGTNGLSVNSISGGVSALATIATSGSISIAGVRVARCTVAGAVTAVTLPTGTLNGQEITIVNENTTAANSITFAASGTSNVANGVSTVVSGLLCARLVWDAGATLWFHSV